jgi:hypothetical protein
LIIDDLAYRDRVDRPIASIEIEDRLVDDTMSRIIEILTTEQIGNMDDTIFVDEEGSEDSSLGIDAMWGSSEVGHIWRA